jgi:tetratricopeptide (TPR) repeat protein
LRECIRLNPKSANLPHIVNFLVRKHQPNEAIKLLQHSIDLQPNFADTHYLLGNLYRDQGKTGEALAAFQQALRLKPDFAEVHNNVASLLAQQGKLAEAEAAYRRALRYKPELPQAIWGLNSICVKTDRWNEAIALARKLAEVDPKSSFAQNLLAWQLVVCPDAGLRDPARSVQAATKATEIDPNDGNLWNTLGVAHYRAGAWTEAVEALRKSDQLLKAAEVNNWLFLAMAHEKLAQHDKARKWYDQAVKWMDEKQTKDPESIRFRAEAAELLGVEVPKAKSDKQ